ncbi:MAG: response regulator [Terracidiphilus sp.]|jgi:CheY-like chemotaxis protein
MILLLDDEGEYIENVLDELRSLGLQVVFLSNVDDALEYIKNNRSNIQAIVCDVMMPHGRAFAASATEDNRITGLRFAEKIREGGIKLPIVFLTNLEPDRAPIEQVAEACTPCVIIRKREKWSFEIAESIRDLIAKEANA